MYKPYRAALEALRREFDRAASRYPGLFYEGFAPPDSSWISGEPWTEMWQAFITANASQDPDSWEQWHIATTANGCSRFCGDGSGVETFKQLADSLNRVLFEIGESLDEEGGWW